MRELWNTMSGQYEEYLLDESKFSGYADSISFPEDEEELIAIMKQAKQAGIPVTIQGGKTGITGGAVPEGGHILNLSHWNKVVSHEIMDDGTGRITVQPGITLMDLNKEISQLFRKSPLFWPPDPTETSAAIGGIAAANAQGICRVLYGNTKDYIERIRVVLYDGTVVTAEDTDTQENFLGKEGITGILSEITLRLLPKPESIWGITFFFEKVSEAGQLIDCLKQALPKAENAAIAAVEYLDGETIRMIEGRKASMTKIKELPDIRKGITDLVYIELHGREEGIEELAEVLMELAAEYGSDPEEAWAVSGETEIDRMHAFRHAAAESANLAVEEAHRKDPRITKLGMDMARKQESFEAAVQRMRLAYTEAGIRGCIFGHALVQHLHVNLLPEDYEEYMRGIELLRNWAEEVKQEQGCILGEHGIGKLKKRIYQGLLPDAYLNLCQRLKEEWDPEHGLNPGNIID